MSNQNKPTFRLPGAPPAPIPPPTGALPDNFAALLQRYPLPWCVGPYGDIWEAADVEEIDKGLDGTRRWRATGDKARLVIENPTSPDIAALIVHAVNRLGR